MLALLLVAAAGYATWRFVSPLLRVLRALPRDNRDMVFV